MNGVVAAGDSFFVYVTVSVIWVLFVVLFSTYSPVVKAYVNDSIPEFNVLDPNQPMFRLRLRRTTAELWLISHQPGPSSDLSLLFGPFIPLCDFNSNDNLMSFFTGNCCGIFVVLYSFNSIV